jgi:hypothetical protein
MDNQFLVLHPGNVIHVLLHEIKIRLDILPTCNYLFFSTLNIFKLAATNLN